jgi:hypothetical protein
MMMMIIDVVVVVVIVAPLFYLSLRASMAMGLEAVGH